jgi:antitoxin component of MazEF toxin-antitoxin module
MPNQTLLSLRRVGNSQGVVLPKFLLEGLDFSRGIEVEKIGGELRLKPAAPADDPFGFRAACLAQVEADEVDELLIPDVLPEDSDF